MLTKRTKAYHSSYSQTISSHFVAVHSWSVRCNRRLQKSIKPLILDVQGFSKSSILIQLKSSSLMLVVIGNMPMVISNCFHEKLANNSKITTFTGSTALWCPCVQVSLNLKNQDLDRWNLRLKLEISSMSIPIDFGAVLSWNVSCSLKVPKKSIKTPYFNVQTHPRTLNLAPIKSQCMTSY